MVSENTLLITGTRIFTADPFAPWAGALLLRGNRVAFVGAEDQARERGGNRAEEIRIPGGLCIPGLNDSHIHMSMGARALQSLNLDHVTSIDDLLHLLSEYAERHPEREWIEAYGLPYEPFLQSSEAPRTIIDTVLPNRPVFLYAFDTHTAWCNTRSLEIANITKGATLPFPHEVVVDEQGHATGMLIERHAHELVRRHMPVPSQREQDETLQLAMSNLNRLGITSVQNMEGDPDRLVQYQRLADSENLTVRASHYLNVWEGTPREYLRDFAGLMQTYTSSWNRVTGIKLFIDGVIETKTAFMREPYEGGSASVGVPDMDPDIYHDLVIRSDALGLAVATHAIGDAGIDLALDAYAAARTENSGDHLRHRVEHVEIPAPDAIGRFAQLGVTASMQPLHAAPGGNPAATPWTTNIGPVREPCAFPWQSLLAAGALLAFGSDWPIVSPDVRLGLHCAITRTDVAGEPVGGWQPHESLTLAQAISAYTRGAAMAENEDGRKGMLRRGMLADITVFGSDPFCALPAEIPASNIVLTVVDGEIVHRTI